MNGNDIDPPRFRPLPKDLWTAFGLLTRLPLPYPAFDAQDPRPAAYAAWAYPIVGIVIGTLSAFVAWVGVWLNLPPVAAALLVVITGIVATGALHQDGLADCADGFWGGWSTARRLEIMKDSQIGTYGVLALLSAFGLSAAALSALVAAGSVFAPFVMAAVVSRAAMIGVMYALPNARGNGLSHITGRPPREAVPIALGLAGLTVLVMGPTIIVWVALWAALATLLVALIARAKIGGQTGDVLGATQQVVEVAILLVCAAALT